MYKLLFTLSLILLLSQAVFAQTSDSDKQTDKVKAAVTRLGTGTKARVQVIRFGKPKVNGFIGEIRENDFVVIGTEKEHIGMAIPVAYDEVVQLKGKGVDWRNGAIKASKGIWYLLGPISGRSCRPRF